MKNLLLTTASQVSKRFTFSPWPVLGQLPHLWRRYFVGGGVAIYQEGPKDARVEYVGCTLATIPYFRRAFLLLVTQIARMLRNVAYVREIPTREPTSIVHCLAWV
ncbi:hypothetical protein LZC95_05270 [Pendulispora brunnea]|uniref:Uncharacterized protein n=1 Tax=Pendulispora brunnea TaxID=2905690 RepID=A0ABZ2KGQ1_9BACT